MRPASAVEVVGKIISSWAILDEVPSGSTVKVTPI
ncbi:MAG TPA: hypothetical protein PLJ96_03565 [Candidatus Atribacteria bacterium]|nr:hypothetical protein [Candidatus Atribacteria bacterium]